MRRNRADWCRIAVGTALALTTTAAPVHADIHLIDENVAGAAYDGLLDGFPFPPPGFAPDGQADQLTGSLAVALLAGVTEERGIVELPLASLTGIAAEDVVTATLVFNIDDVLSTFGPGTTFDGTAAEALVLFAYAGNGSIDLADFGNVAGAPLAVVSTTAHGTITDATLAAGGPLQFEVDVTTALAARLSADDDFLGLVFATQDSGSATSLDNLGSGGAGPAGVGGAVLPWLRVVTRSDEPVALGKEALRCQRTLAGASGKLQTALRRALQGCMDAVLTAVARGEEASSAASPCTAAIDRADASSTVSRALAKHASAIASACADVAPADLGSPCDDEAAEIDDVAACTSGRELDDAGEAMKRLYPRACGLLDAVGFGSTYSAACLAD